MDRLRPRVTYANLVATLALIVAVAGIPTAVAISKSSAKSDVNKKGNIRAGRVTADKLASGAVTATKLGAVDVVQATGTGSAIALCPTGELRVGGGGEISSGLSSAVKVSRPQANGWLAGQNGGEGPQTVIAYALCLEG
jgi:hypothetical protein